MASVLTVSFSYKLCHFVLLSCKFPLYQVGKHEKMGMNVIPLKDVTPEEPKEITVNLLKNMDLNDAQNEKNRGEIVLKVLYKPFKEDETPVDEEDPNSVQKAPEGTPATGGLLAVIVHEATDVEGKHHTNPYVRLLFRGEEKKTKVYICILFLEFARFLS